MNKHKSSKTILSFMIPLAIMGISSVAQATDPCNQCCNDYDHDGVCHDHDICPGGDDRVDTDDDGIPDHCDECPLDEYNDADGDGVCGDVDPCPHDPYDCCEPPCPDHDGDGTCDDEDPCPYDPYDCCEPPPPHCDDYDNDGRCDDEDPCPHDPHNDADGDGVCGDDDECPGTPEVDGVPTVSLGTNRFADIDGDGDFDTTSPNGKGPQRSYTLEDTAGCNCEQIIDELNLGNGHTKFGCSISAMDDWVDMVSGYSAPAPTSGLELQAPEAPEAVLISEEFDDLSGEPQAGGCNAGTPNNGATWAFLGLMLAAVRRRRRS
jgi:uncharacterized protein (TIGR03382 family)